MSVDGPVDWREWDAKWRPVIANSAHGLEWNFAKEVIQRVPGLKPSDVTPQRSFVGDDGRERHMDFGIEVQGRRIAFEVEGWDKTGGGHGKSKQEHDEFNLRVQSLTASGWLVMPITNAQFMSDPGLYASKLRQLLVATTSLPPESRVVVSAPMSMPPVRSPVLAPTGGASPEIVVNGRNGSNQRGLWWALGLALATLMVLVTVAIVLASSGQSHGPERSIDSSPASLANPGNVKDCEDFTTQAEAQKWFDTYRPAYGDVANLDGDKDGQVCTELP